MKHYNILQAFYMSFYSRKLYRDVVQNWGAGVVLYLFLLLAVSWVVELVSAQPAINAGLEKVSHRYAGQLPVIKIKDGVLKTPENKPYFINEPETKQVVAIIDTSGKYQDFTNVPKDAQILVTRDSILFQENSKGVKTQKIPDSLDLTLEPEQLKTTLMTSGKWLTLIFFPIVLLGSFIYRLLQALVYAVIGKTFSALSNIRLSYSNILKITMISITPVIVLDTVLDLFSITFYLQWVTYFVISMFYLIFAIGANKNGNQQ